MDSITQIVLGAAVGEAVGGRKMGGKAALWGAIAGTLPDLDVFLRLFNHPIDAALLHRGFSHSIVFACLMGPILGWLIHRLYKKRYDQKMWVSLFFWAILTHPLLDIFTNYGTELLWPFSLRITFNSVFVLDPLYTLPFVVFLLIALFLKRENVWRKRMNWTGIIYSCTYLLWGVIVKLTILQAAPTYFKESGVKAQNIMAGPMPLTSFYWMMMGEDEDHFYVTYRSIFGNYHPSDLEIIKKDHNKLHNIKWKGKDYSDQLEFISNGYYTTEWQGDTLNFYDLRFGTATQLTNKEVQLPIMGYGMVVDNGFVYKTISLRNSNLFEKVNFDVYWNKVLNRYE